MRAILKWMIVLLLLTAVAGGSGVYWCYLRSDEMLRTEVLKQFEQIAPDMKIELERANFDFTGRIRLVGLSMQLRDEREPAFYVPEAIITLEDQQLTDFENVSIRRLRLVHPQLHMVRRLDGSWNWQGSRWQFAGGQAVPEIDIEHGTIVVDLQRSGKPARKLKLADVSVSALPASARKLTAVVSTRIDPAGPLTATVEADLDGPPLNVELKWQRLPVDDELLELIGEFSPAVNDKLQTARTALAKLAATQAASSSIHPATRNAGGNASTSPISLRSQFAMDARPSPLGLKVNCNLHARLSWNGPETPLQYQVLTELEGGQFSNVVLPFSLQEISGSIFVDPKQVIVRHVKAENGSTQLTLDGRLVPGDSPKLELHLRNVQLDEALIARLPESLRKVIYSYSLSGVCDMDLNTVAHETGVTWNADVRLARGSLRYEKFPYPIRDVTGTIRLRGSRIEIEGHGKASGIPVSVTGWVVNPGPANECEIIVRTLGAPINTVLLDSCPENVRKALLELNLQGTHDVRFRVAKPTGPGQKYHLSALIQLQDCSCVLSSFPYRINRLKGTIEWNDEVIKFKQLTGVHDETRLTAVGRFLRIPGPGRLDLAIHAENAAFDRSLEAAIPKSLHHLWQEFQPAGRFDVETRIGWTPGQSCQVALPRIKITDAEMTMRSFSWPMRGIQGEFSYEAPRLTIKSFSAQHDDTQISGRGFATFAPNEPWRVRFEELHVDDLNPNSTFRKALPGQLQRAFDSLKPGGKYSIATTAQGAVEFLGTGPEQPISANWDVQVLLTDCSLSAGILIEDIYGRVGLKGSFDGQSTNLTGALDLDSISVFRQPSGLAHQISRVVGPIRLENGVFTGGAAVLSSPPTGQPHTPVPLAERISGDAIDGKLTLDVVADLRKEPDYRVYTTLSRGRLESYARHYLRGQSNLAGIMNGWLYLWGKGQGEDSIKGRGELQIAPAALYELPVFVQIFQAFRLDSVDRTAFDRADILFHIQNSRFNFDTIDLVGKAVSLRGRGFVRFDGALQLDFYSMLARNQIRIPVIHEFAGMLSRGWVGVKVTGHIGAPQTRIIPVPEFDEAMKQFLGSFEAPATPSRQNTMIPKLLRPIE